MSCQGDTTAQHLRSAVQTCHVHGLSQCLCHGTALLPRVAIDCGLKAPNTDCGMTCLAPDVVAAVLAYLIAALSPNMDTANAALPAYVTALLFFSGFLIVWPQIPKYWIWLAYLDFLRYAWGALMINQYQGTQVIPPPRPPTSLPLPQCLQMPSSS